MDTQPVYNEDDFMVESAKREVRKLNQLQNNGETEGNTNIYTNYLYLFSKLIFYNLIFFINYFHIF